MGSCRLYRILVSGAVLGLFIWLSGPGWAAETMTADDLFYVTENFPPHNYMEDGELKGISVEVLELIWKKLGADRKRSQVQVLPWARAIKMLESHSNMVLFGMGYTRERGEKFQWAGPYFTHELSLISRSDNPVLIRSMDDARQMTIGVVRMDIGHQFLEEHGFDPSALEFCDDVGQLHQKFIYQRFQLICYVPHAYFVYSESQGIPRSEFKNLFTLSVSRSGFGFSRQVPGTLVRQFQKALDELRDEGTLKSILKRYGVE